MRPDIVIGCHTREERSIGMHRGVRKAVIFVAVPLLVAGGALAARALGPAGGGTLTNGIAFYGPYSGAQFPAAGSGTIAPGHTSASIRVLLPAFSIPNAGGGQDENHVIATIQGYVHGYWIVGAEIRPFVSDYGRQSGRLVVWLNKPAPPGSEIRFSYMTFGIFND
jgi:hypothetical protein